MPGVQAWRASSRSDGDDQMKKSSSGSRRRAGSWPAAVVAAVAGAALLAACGSHPPASGTDPGLPTRQQVDAYAQCMRSHGVTNFYLSRPNSANPDPNEIAIGLLPYGVVYGVDPSSPQYQSANSACQHLLPGGGARMSVTSGELRSMDRGAACMRSHGFPGYPDPGVQNGQLVPGPLPTTIDTSSPQFQAALQTCHPGQ